MSRQVILSNADVSDTVLSVSDIVPDAGDYGQVLSSTIPQLQGIADLWDPSRPASPFFGVPDVRVFPVQVLNDGIITFDGTVLSLSTDGPGRSVTVGLRSEMQKTLESGLIYSSAADESPATAFRSICDLYNLAYDTDSVSRAESLYGANNILVRVHNLIPDMTILAGFQRLAEIGIARIYAINSILYFDAWEDKSADTSVLIAISGEQASEYLLMSRPSVERMTKQKMDGYVVEWIGDVAGSNAFLDGDYRRTISGSQDQPVRIQTRASAIWIGNQWLAYLNRPQDRITFRMAVEVARSIPINSPVSVIYSEWDEPVIMDITRISASGLVFGELVGISR